VSRYVYARLTRLQAEQYHKDLRLDQVLEYNQSNLGETKLKQSSGVTKTPNLASPTSRSSAPLLWPLRQCELVGRLLGVGVLFKPFPMDSLNSLKLSSHYRPPPLPHLDRRFYGLPESSDKETVLERKGDQIPASVEN